MNHLILTNLIDVRIHNLKGLIETSKHCIQKDINTKNNIINKTKFEKELDILQKNKQIIFDNFSLFK